MARPKKTGLDYFPFDVDFFDDEKIVCIAGEYGIKGELTAIKLLCAIYRNGYFIEWSEVVQLKMLKSLPGVSLELLNAIVNRLVKWGFFDKSLFDSTAILTSFGIQKRYFQAVNRRIKTEKLPYLLVSVSNMSTETQLMSTETTQKKGNKIKKEIESKDSTKKGVIVDNNSSGSNNEPNSIETLREHFLSDMASENLMMSMKIQDKDTYMQLCNEILTEWQIVKGTDFVINSDVKMHFKNTLRVKAEMKRKECKYRGDISERLKTIIDEISQEKKLNGYTSEMCNLFFNYWTEVDNNGNMRFENEEYWSTANRLTIWNLRKKA